MYRSMAKSGGRRIERQLDSICANSSVFDGDGNEIHKENAKYSRAFN